MYIKYFIETNICIKNKDLGLESSTYVNIKMVHIIMAGERVIAAEKLALSRTVILGPGLRRDENQVIAYKCGELIHREPNIFWVDNYQTRYTPVRGDTVIGLITFKARGYFRVNIGAQEQATLSFMAFESATKTNRPDIKPGDLVYARLVNADRDFEPELVCVNSAGKQSKLGLLSNGIVLNCSLNLARAILHKDCPLLSALAVEMPYEIAVGLNGRIWINAQTIAETIALGNAILAAEKASNDDIIKICQKIGNLLIT